MNSKGINENNDSVLPRPFGKFKTFQDMWKESKLPLDSLKPEPNSLKPPLDSLKPEPNSLKPPLDSLKPEPKELGGDFKLRQVWELFLILPTSESLLPKSFGKFTTIREMWEYLNNIFINDIPSGYGIAIFQEGCQPTWEDEKNKLGARMMVSISNKTDKKAIQLFFIEASMLLFGGSLGTEAVTGLMFAKRPKYIRTAIWMSDYSNLSLAKEIGLQFKAIGIKAEAFLPSEKFEFQRHDSNDYNNYLLVL